MLQALNLLLVQLAQTSRETHSLGIMHNLSEAKCHLLAQPDPEEKQEKTDRLTVGRAVRPGQVCLQRVGYIQSHDSPVSQGGNLIALNRLQHPPPGVWLLGT